MRNSSKIFTILVGAFIVLMGLSIIFGLVIPIFKILLGIFFIYLGFVIITKRRHWHHWHHRHNSTIFEEQSINISAEKIDKEYSVVFGKANYDFSNINLKDGNITVKVSVVFGRAVIRLNKEMAVRISCSVAFGSSKTPDGVMISFGKHEYDTSSFDMNKPHIYIDADTAFGSLEII